jgi:hypothetical protein
VSIAIVGGKPGDENVVMELMDEDLDALRKLRGLA